MANEADSGARCSESSMRSDPVGFLLKTCLLSELEELTGCSATWKESATPAGRSWWVLVMSERRTGETACGSWPTPNKCDGERGPESTEAKAHRKNAGGGNLAGMIQYTMRTLEKSPHEQIDADELAKTVGCWPTPNQRDWKDTGPTQGERKSPNLGTEVHLVAWKKIYPDAPDVSDGPPDPANVNTTGNPQGYGPTKRGVLWGPWVLQLMGYPSDWCDAGIEKP